MGFISAPTNLASPSAIGSTTPNTGAFTTLSATPPANSSAFTSTGYSLTGANAQSFFDLSGTWNTSGTPTAFKLNVTDTASNASSLLMDLQVGGSSKFRVEKGSDLYVGTKFYYNEANGDLRLGTGPFHRYGFSPRAVWTYNDGIIAWNSTANVASSSLDLILARDAAGTLAQRNSTNAQTFRIYNTFTDASNYERGFMQWSSNVLSIGAEAAGTGTNRVLRLSSNIDDGIEFYLGTRVMSAKQSGGFVQIYYTSNPWLISAAVAGSGNTNFVGQPIQINAGRGTGSGANGYIQFRAAPSTSSGTGQHPFLEEAFRISVPATGAPFCSFGGTTSSFPALKRSSAVLQARLADDSGFAQVQGKLTTDTNYTLTAPLATGYLTIYDASGTAYKVLCST